MHHRRVSCWSDKCFTLIYACNACSARIIIEAHRRPPTFTKNFAFLISQFHCRLCTFGRAHFVTRFIALDYGLHILRGPEIDIDVEIDDEILLHYANIIVNFRVPCVSLLLWTGYFVIKVVRKHCLCIHCMGCICLRAHLIYEVVRISACDVVKLFEAIALTCYRNNMARHKSATTFLKLSKARMQIHTVERLGFVFGSKTFGIITTERITWVFCFHNFQRQRTLFAVQ